MARNGAPPMPSPGRRCKVPYCTDTSIEKALFCATHELLWVAEVGHPSYKLKPKHGRRYRKYIRREGEKLNPYARVMRQMQSGRLFIAPSAGKSWRTYYGK